MANLATTKAKVAAADAAQGTGGLLTRKVDIAAKALLTKKVNPNQVWQVIGVIDRSGSMHEAYASGTVQEVVNRMLGFAVIVDDDGTVPLVLFDHTIMEREVKLNDFHDYISRNGIRANGTTDLTAALATVARMTGNGDLAEGGGFFSRGGEAPSIKKAQTPAYVIVVTDGAPNNQQSATDMIRKLSWRGVFLKFLYVGTRQSDPQGMGWSYLESLDDDIPVGVPYKQGGRLIDNVDAKNMSNIAKMSDQEFYEKMFDEVTTWLSAARQAGLI